MYFHNVPGTGRYTTSTTNMYNKGFTYSEALFNAANIKSPTPARYKNRSEKNSKFNRICVKYTGSCLLRFPFFCRYFGSKSTDGNVSLRPNVFPLCSNTLSSYNLNCLDCNVNATCAQQFIQHTKSTATSETTTVYMARAVPHKTPTTTTTNISSY